MTLRDDFYECASVYATVGMSEQAAACFFHAAFINRAFQSNDEVVVALTAAVDHLQVTHPVVAAEVHIKLAKSYESAGLLLQAARARRAAAIIHDTHMNDKPGAAALYSAAIATYMQVYVNDDISETLCEACIERLCILHVEMGHYDIAESLFLDRARNRVLRVVVQDAEKAAAEEKEAQTACAAEAESADEPASDKGTIDEDECEETNVTKEDDDTAAAAAAAAESAPGDDGSESTFSDDGSESEQRSQKKAKDEMVQRVVGKRPIFPRTALYLYATLCRLAVGSEDDSAYFDALYLTRKLFEKLQDEDRNYQKGSLNALMRGIIASYETSSLHEFDSVVRTYVELKTTQPSAALDVLIKQCRFNLVAHIERFL